MRSRALATILAAATWLAGCGTGGFLRDPFDPSAWSYHSQEDEPLVLDVAGPVAVDVDSFGGDVIITANDKLYEATVTVRREARHGATRKKESKASLAEIHYSAVVMPSGSGPRLEVRTWTDHAEPYYQRAHLEINIPAVDGLTVRTRWGLIEAVDIEGTVHIEGSEGDVRVMTNRPMRRPVTVINRKGDIDYRVRGESTGAFDCQSAGGKVLYRARQCRFIADQSSGSALVATLNDGENPIQLRTTGGDIRVAVVPDPTKIGETIVDP
ncbi:MAG: DUF4097 family beta strand repeat-containing protein [Planctomycetota bacterium]|jgi:hypothetical protein